VASLGRDLAGCSEVIQIDAPGPSGLGDCLARLGEGDALRRLGKRVSVRTAADLARCERLQGSMGRQAAVLVSTPADPADRRGGGLDGLQALLEQVPPQMPVVALCRAALGDDFEVSPGLARAVGASRRFVLRVCDTDSEVIARQRLECPIELVPDPMFMLRPRARGAASVDAVGVFGVAGAKTMPSDLLDALADADLSIRVIESTEIRAQLFGGWFDAIRGLRRALSPDAEHLAQRDRALRALCSGAVVLTDAFPMAVLACLLGKPVVALEDPGGTLSARMRTWLADWPMLRCAASPSDALFQMQRLRDTAR
jgi:hypothetical protein